jgi:uncharacterized protein (TIGR00270 family)
MECEVCGSGNAYRKAKIEGVLMDVCDKCVSLGDEIIAPRITVVEKNVRLPEELDVSVRSDLGSFVKGRREKMKLTQEELARKLFLNASIITRVENGWMPPLAVVEKLEKFFKTSLKETAEAGATGRRTNNKALTLADVVEIKRKK